MHLEEELDVDTPAWDEEVAAAVVVVAAVGAAVPVVGAEEEEQSKTDYSSGEWSARCWEWVLVALVAGRDS